MWSKKLSGIYPIEDTIVNNLNEIVHASPVEFLDTQEWDWEQFWSRFLKKLMIYTSEYRSSLRILGVAFKNHKIIGEI